MGAQSKHVDYPAVRRIGEDGLLVEFASGLSDAANIAALAFRSRVDQCAFPGVIETASALKSTYLRFRPDEIAHERLEGDLRALLAERDWLSAALPEGRRRWRVPACFGGEDGPHLEEVADAVGTSPDAAIAEIAESRLRVLAMGFAPGMPYLGILPERWDVPRLQALTPRVPVGALVVAVRQIVLFSVEAQTGWQQIGRAGFRAFDPDRDPVFQFAPGDEVSFEPSSRSDVLSRLETGAPLPSDPILS